MDFYKKILVLNQIEKNCLFNGKEISGIVRVESEDNITTLSLSLINFPFLSDGEYILAVLFENSPIEIISLDKKPTSFLKVFYSLQKFAEFSIGIFYKNQGYFPVAFTKTEKGVDLQSLTILLTKAETSNNLGPTPVYDDEAVATEDYFALEEKIKDKIQLLEGWENERQPNEVVKNDSLREKDSKKRALRADGGEDEEKPIQSQTYNDEHPYYQSAKNELDNLFRKFPKENSLSSILPNSQFCRINYSADKYYVVGVVKEENKEKYICYGVPSNYSEEPPKELKDYCCFLPKSIFNLKGDGFWMMFQDAVTGNCVKK